MTRSGRAPWAQWRLTGQESLFYCTYSLTASHCSAKAHLAGVPFPRSFDSPLVLRQSCSARLKRLVWCGCKKIHQFRILIKAFLVKKKGTKTVLSRVAKLRSVAPCASDVCVENFSHSARLLLQQSRASFKLASCLREVFIASPDTWVWTRMHTLAVMHRHTLCENVDSAKIKVPFSTTNIDILHMASMHRIVIHRIDISIQRSAQAHTHTLQPEEQRLMRIVLSMFYQTCPAI